MFLITLRLPRHRFLAGAAAALCLLAAGGLRLSPPIPEPAPVSVVRQSPVGQKLRTEARRAALLRSLGWEISETPILEETLLIPREMEESEYLALQREQGFDLPALAGQRVKRYLYAPENAPELRVELLICQHRLVGGSVYSTEPQGPLFALIPHQ